MKINYDIEFELDLTKEGVAEAEKVHGALDKFIKNCKEWLKQVLVYESNDLEPEYGTVKVSVNVKE